LSSFNCRKRSSLTASASKAAWKNDTVCNHCNQGLTFDRLIKRPVNNRLRGANSVTPIPLDMWVWAHLNNMTIVPIRLATLVFAHAIEMSKITLAVVRLKSTSVEDELPESCHGSEQSQRVRTQYLQRAMVGQRVAEGCRIGSK